jgi:hemolysin III
MSEAAARDSTPHHPTWAEEIVHAITHGVGAIGSIVVLVMLVGLAATHGSTQNVVAASVFGASLLGVYLSSTVYHAVPRGWERTKGVLQIIDHAAIHFLIAGTSTPFALVAIGGSVGWILLAVIWSLALAGVIVETTPLRRYAKLSMGFYLGNGWVGVLALPLLWGAITTGTLVLLVGGGLAYTAGVPFFLAHRRKWMHAWWHGFVLAGSGLHVAAIALVLASHG